MSEKTTSENENIETPASVKADQIGPSIEHKEMNSDSKVVAVKSETNTDVSPDDIHEKSVSQSSVEPKQDVDDANQCISKNDLNASKVIGGAPVRQWINSEITPSLLKGMKMVSVTQPDQPLKVLGEFLLQENQRLLEQKQSKATIN